MRFLTNIRQIFRMHCIKYALGLILMTPLLVFGQVKISGIVKDDTGKPLEGVSVTLKNKPNGTQTDAAGRFTLNASAGSTLIFSIVGYEETQISVGQKSSYDVSLKQKGGAMNEVVVVG